MHPARHRRLRGCRAADPLGPAGSELPGAAVCLLIPLADLERTYQVSIVLQSNPEAPGVCFANAGPSGKFVRLSIDPGDRWLCTGRESEFFDLGELSCWDGFAILTCAKGWTTKLELPLMPPLGVDVDLSELKALLLLTDAKVIEALPDRGGGRCRHPLRPPLPSATNT